MSARSRLGSVVAAVLVGSPHAIGVALSTTPSASGDVRIDPSQTAVMFGGPLLIAAVGTAAVAAAAVLVHLAAHTGSVVVEPVPIILIGGAGFALMLAATVIPALRTTGDPAVRALAAE